MRSPAELSASEGSRISLDSFAGYQTTMSINSTSVGYAGSRRFRCFYSRDNCDNSSIVTPERNSRFATTETINTPPDYDRREAVGAV
jgi:hypothetical protein